MMSGLTWPAPALIISAVFVLDIQISRADFIVELVGAFHFDMRVHNGHHLLKNNNGQKKIRQSVWRNKKELEESVSHNG